MKILPAFNSFSFCVILKNYPVYSVAKTPRLDVTELRGVFIRTFKVFVRKVWYVNVSSMSIWNKEWLILVWWCGLKAAAFVWLKSGERTRKNESDAPKRLRNFYIKFGFYNVVCSTVWRGSGVTSLTTDFKHFPHLSFPTPTTFLITPPCCLHLWRKSRDLLD